MLDPVPGAREIGSTCRLHPAEEREVAIRNIHENDAALRGFLITLGATVLIVAGALHFAQARYSEYLGAKEKISVLEGAARKPFMGSGDPERGMALFAANCVSCHGVAGRGEIGLAPNIGNRDFLALASDLFIKETVNHGREETAMIARPDLSDEALTHIIAYLRSVPSGGPMEVVVDHDKVLDGDPARGEPLFHTFCAPCHGPNGEGYAAGGAGSGIGLPGFLDVASDDYILQTLYHGRTGTPMRPFIGARGLAGLTEEEAGDIIAFLRNNSSNAVESALHMPVLYAGPPNPATGEKIFMTNCASCHQTGGVGKPGLAPSIRNRDFLAIASDDFIKSTVLQGRAGTAMVPRADLGESAIEQIIAYLRDLSVAVPLTVQLNPDRKCTGDAARGRSLYRTFCSSCHGARGEGYSAGGAGPGIGLPGFLSVATDGYIFETVKTGRVGTPMRPFIGARGLANLSEQDVNDIIVYLRSLQVSDGV